MSYGSNPGGTIAEVNAEFDAFLRDKFPNDAFNPDVTLSDTYCFDVHLSYDWNNYDSTPMYLAILEFVLSHFSAGYGIDLHIYHSP
jgi:hypothetical protein